MQTLTINDLENVYGGERGRPGHSHETSKTPPHGGNVPGGNTVNGDAGGSQHDLFPVSQDDDRPPKITP